MVPFVILIPTACRILQCFKVYRATGEVLNLVNLVKYLTTVPVVLISIVKKVSPEVQQWIGPIWALSVVVFLSNALICATPYITIHLP